MQIRSSKSVVGRAAAARSRSAFTLLELLVVIAIIGIIGIVVVPEFLRAATPQGEMVAAQPVVQLLKFAQQTAVRRNVRVTVTIDPSSASYVATADGDDTALVQGMLALPMGGQMQTDSLRARFVFEPTGNVVGDSVFVVSNAGTVLVRPNPWSGEINVLH